MDIPAHFDQAAFREDLLAWYDASHRQLPWRETRDPYAILVSELMLQQTRVQTVLPYYEVFLRRFPDVQTLAEADEALVLKTWQGLGYYRRARHLQAAARQVIERFDGRFPREKAEIDSLAGVGAYTSAAVASFAFGQRWACVDGNVMRVLTRLLALDDDIAQQKTKRELTRLAQQLISYERPGDYNQALMELGAVQCTPREPACLACPLRAHCQTVRRLEDPGNRPVKSKRAQPSAICFDALFLFCEDRFLLARRRDEGLMAGMWELPARVSGEGSAWKRHFSGPISPWGPALPPLLHKFTHLHATYVVRPFRAEEQLDWLAPPNAYTSFRWVNGAALESLPTTKVLRKLMPNLQEILDGDTPCPNAPYTLPGTRTTK